MGPHNCSAVWLIFPGVIASGGEVATKNEPEHMSQIMAQLCPRSWPWDGHTDVRDTTMKPLYFEIE